MKSLQAKRGKLSLWHLSWPIAIEMLLQFLMGTVDSIMVSRIGDHAVSAGAYVFAIVLKWGLVGVMLGLMLDEVFRAVLVLNRWRQRKTLPLQRLGREDKRAVFESLSN